MTKQELQALVDELLDEVDPLGLADRLILLHKLERSERQIAYGGTLSQGEVLARLSSKGCSNNSARLDDHQFQSS